MAENETNGSDNGAGVQPPTEMGLRIQEVQRQDKLWATDTQRRLRVLHLLKNWTVGADSFYTMLKNMDVDGNAMLKYVVDESLSDPMTLVDVQPQDCALKLNRVCLRAKNINPKLAGFCRVDGTRFVKTDALLRYQAAMNVVPLFDTILWSVVNAPEDAPVLDPFLQSRSWAMFDFPAMRVRAPTPPSPVPASRPTLAPPPPAAPAQHASLPHARRRTRSATWRRLSTSCARWTSTATSAWSGTRRASRVQPRASRRLAHRRVRSAGGARPAVALRGRRRDPGVQPRRAGAGGRLSARDDLVHLRLCVRARARDCLVAAQSVVPPLYR